MKQTFLNGMTPEYFLKHYWNKRPYHFKAAVPNAPKLGEREDFFKLARDPDFESRMVIEAGGDYPWQSKLGPFKKSDYKKKALWTLVCHNLELQNEPFQDLKRQVSFIPEWHFDDIMATISTKGSSVGAHIDDYSVFIIQGKGKRRWLLEENPAHDYLPDLDIRLLAKFNPTEEIILEPGDMLYLPPNLAHHGISIEDSISYSIGFQSVRYNHLIVHHAMELMNELEGVASFRDKQPLKAQDRFEVPKNVSDAIYDEVITLLSDRNRFDNSLLKFLSRPKTETTVNEDYSEKEALRIFKSKKLLRDPWAKMVSSKKKKGLFQVAINQKVYDLNKTEYDLLSAYFEPSPLKSIKVKASDLKVEAVKKILIDGLNSGVFRIN